MIESEKPIGTKEKRFLADIYSSDEELIAQGIRCKLILNEIRYTEPITLLYPTSKKEYDAITVHSELSIVSIKGYRENIAGKKTGEIHISKGRLHPRIAHYGASWHEYILEVVFPEEIYEKSHLGVQNQDKSRIFFFNRWYITRPELRR